MSTRRKFLLDCSAALAGVALLPFRAAALPALAGSQSPAAGRLGYAALAGQVNTVFRVQLASGQTVKLWLVKAGREPQILPNPGGRPPADAGNERFSLFFNGPAAPLLESAIHQFEHDQLGRFEMHLGEIGLRDSQAIRYQAVFNQCPPPDSPPPISR